ncbi:MAG: UDP-N-acetylmuramoyl-L-alanyl-D-glutamate--2,6-diaminopimelate ligase [candidate division Zixibacteria bacterium]|nr:UDP-N-acetylmuramoyl-L-alanyl-D-glutamate--2,6-diaminopimelate ligase [candidate division Zixibacteria bacterium]
MTREVDGAIIYGAEDIDVSGIEYDSKMIQPGSVFVAIRGFATDGNKYIDDAIAKGAVAVVTDQECNCSVPQVVVPDARRALADLAAKLYNYANNRIKICGVTGTNGKTTSCFLLRNLFYARSKRTGIITSLEYDTTKDKIAASRTTPEALDIHRLLHIMKNNFCTNAIIEISSHALVLHRVRNLDIQVALYTNFTRDHLDFHNTMEEYLEAKAKLLDFVNQENKWAVINYDCPEFMSLKDRITGSYMTYSLSDPGADVYLEHFTLNPEGSRFEIHSPMGNRAIKFRLPGRFNLYNALGAATAAMASGIDIDSIKTGLENSKVIPGRLERIKCNAPFSIFVDYAHTPDAITRTIESLRELGDGRILTLFGCGGDRDRGKRPLMGKAATEASNYSVLTSDNPRSEDPEQIIEDVKPGFAEGARVDTISDRDIAISHLLGQAKEGDILLLAGKGAEPYQDINGVKHPFLDKDVALTHLDKMGYSK